MHFHLPTLDHINGGKASKSPHDRLYRNGSQSARQITRGVHTQDGKTYSSKSNSSFNISSSNSPKFGKVNSSKKRSDKGGRKNANGGAGGVRKRNKIKASLENNSSEAVLAEDILSSLGHSTLSKMQRRSRRCNSRLIAFHVSAQKALQLFRRFHGLNCELSMRSVEDVPGHALALTKFSDSPEENKCVLDLLASLSNMTAREVQNRIQALPSVVCAPLYRAGAVELVDRLNQFGCTFRAIRPDSFAPVTSITPSSSSSHSPASLSSSSLGPVVAGEERGPEEHPFHPNDSSQQSFNSNKVPYPPSSIAPSHSQPSLNNNSNDDARQLTPSHLSFHAVPPKRIQYFSVHMITYDPAHRGRIKHELMQLLKSIGLPLLCDLEKIDQREINDLHELAAREKKEQEDRDALIHREKNIHSMEQELKDKENDWLVERAKLRRADAARQKETEKRFELAQQRKKQQWGKQAAKAKEKELEAKRKEEEWAIREREMEKKLQEKWASMEEQIRVLEREGREREQELDAQLASERTELEAERREVLKLKKELADKIKNATNVAATAADDNNR